MQSTATVSSADPPLMEACRLAIGYRGYPVLQDVTFRVGRGQWWLIAGPNGAGKSTLLRTLAGVQQPLAGRILRSVPERPLCAFMAQQPEINLRLPTTAREVVLLGVADLRLSAHERRARADEVLAAVGLAQRQHDCYRTLSGGIRQRVLLARALIRRAPLMLLDEPLNAVDPQSRGAILELLAAHCRNLQGSVVIVSHDPAPLEPYTTHVLMLQEGTCRPSPASPQGLLC